MAADLQITHACVITSDVFDIIWKLSTFIHNTIRWYYSHIFLHNSCQEWEQRRLKTHKSF